METIIRVEVNGHRYYKVTDGDELIETTV